MNVICTLVFFHCGNLSVALCIVQILKLSMLDLREAYSLILTSLLPINTLSRSNWSSNRSISPRITGPIVNASSFYWSIESNTTDGCSTTSASLFVLTKLRFRDWTSRLRYTVGSFLNNWYKAGFFTWSRGFIWLLKKSRNSGNSTSFAGL